MKQFRLLCEVTFSQELVSRTKTSYLRIEVKPMLISVGGVVVTQEQLGLTVNTPLSVYNLYAHAGNVTKCSTGSLVVLNVTEHVAGVTSYVKEETEIFHTEDSLNVDFVELLSDIELFDMFENKVISKEKYKFLKKKLDRSNYSFSNMYNVIRMTFCNKIKCIMNRLKEHINHN